MVEKQSLDSVLIKSVTGDSQLFASVKALARANTRTLGFLPEGAFDAYAQDGWILAAASSTEELLGYLMYRITDDRWAKIVHLCVVEAHRRKGIAQALFTKLVQRVQGLRGIYLRARRDFPANSLWPKLGLAAVHEIPGRSRRGTTLTIWIYERMHPGLFSVVNRHLLEVVIDLNVFYDLHFPRETSAESQTLLAPWVGDEIKLCVATELFNEINRLQDGVERRRQRAWASRFERILGPHEEFESTQLKLEEILGHPVNERKASDIRHLAHTVAAGVRFFVTRDADLLNHALHIQVDPIIRTAVRVK